MLGVGGGDRRLVILAEQQITDRQALMADRDIDRISLIGSGTQLHLWQG
jgi:hypothetical protein